MFAHVAEALIAHPMPLLGSAAQAQPQTSPRRSRVSATEGSAYSIAKNVDVNLRTALTVARPSFPTEVPVRYQHGLPRLLYRSLSLSALTFPNHKSFAPKEFPSLFPRVNSGLGILRFGFSRLGAQIRAKKAPPLISHIRVCMLFSGGPISLNPVT
jgi:hypothetical protein